MSQIGPDGNGSQLRLGSVGGKLVARDGKPTEGN